MFGVKFDYIIEYTFIKLDSMNNIQSDFYVWV